MLRWSKRYGNRWTMKISNETYFDSHNWTSGNVNTVDDKITWKHCPYFTENITINFTKNMASFLFITASTIEHYFFKLFSKTKNVKRKKNSFERYILKIMENMKDRLENEHSLIIFNFSVKSIFEMGVTLPCELVTCNLFYEMKNISWKQVNKAQFRDKQHVAFT